MAKVTAIPAALSMASKLAVQEKMAEALANYGTAVNKRECPRKEKVEKFYHFASRSPGPEKIRSKSEPPLADKLLAAAVHPSKSAIAEADGHNKP